MLVNLIIDELEVKRQDIFMLDELLDLHPTEVVCGPSFSFDYNDEDVKKIYSYYAEKRKKEAAILKENKEKKILERKLYLEQMHKEHPLVTNDKFFNLSYFPDIIPNCYKGDDFED